jgi:hypothetical protein
MALTDVTFGFAIPIQVKFIVTINGIIRSRGGIFRLYIVCGREREKASDGDSGSALMH